MISKILISVDDTKYLDDYRKVGITTFLFPLEGYCVGYKTYSLEEINNCEVSKKFILINRVLDSESVDNLRKLLPLFVDIEGILFEDIAIYMLVRELKLDLKLIFFQNHFQTNTESVNFWLKKVDSVMLSNEITKKEITDILSGAMAPVCIHLFGYNQVMYSRRKLLSNWCLEKNVDLVDKMIITDRATKVKFRPLENEYGTVMYSENIYNGKDLLNFKNVLFFYVNTMMVDHELVMKFLTDKLDNYDNMDSGFLDKETIYKLREVPR